MTNARASDPGVVMIFVFAGEVPDRFVPAPGLDLMVAE